MLKLNANTVNIFIKNLVGISKISCQKIATGNFQETGNEQEMINTEQLSAIAINNFTEHIAESSRLFSVCF